MLWFRKILHFFGILSGIFLSSQLLIGSRNRRIPATQPTDSCKLTEVTAIGLAASMTKTENASAVGGSYSRLNTVASIISQTMIQARVTEGVNPATAAKSSSTGIPTAAVENRRRKVNIQTRVYKIEICRPETAIIWRIPLTLKAVSVS